jgi:hypothetical protein
LEVVVVAEWALERAHHLHSHLYLALKVALLQVLLLQVELLLHLLQALKLLHYQPN